MIDGTFDVRVYSIERRARANGYTYKVVWKVGTKKHSKTFATKALADARRSDLLTAVKRGEPFSVETGVPVSYSSKAADTNWYDFAVEFVDKTWPHVSANQRKNVAKALTSATIALLRTPPKQFDPVIVRTALREWAFNFKRRTNPEEPMPDDVRVILDWVQRNALSMAAWEQSDRVDAVVSAFGTLLDGTAAAASSVSRNRRIMNLAMEYAVRHGILRQNPLPKGKGSGGGAPKVAQAIDKRSLLNPEQVTALLDWIGKRPLRRGTLYRAFFATLCYAGLRPEEAVALYVSDATLPETGWGEFIVHSARPEVGSQWTDSGEPHDDRDLKGRAEGDTRTVPIHPDLVAFLREVIAEYKLKPTDLLFPGEFGGRLAGSVFRRVWDKAREEVLQPHDYESPAGKRVYDCRHTCLTAWLNKGIPPAQVAEWAGNSVPVLLAIYARCIVGQRDNYLQQIVDVRYVVEAE
ncbi:tyrosine-type recombinase/integrase [Streptomyces griseoviridis]|uniref:tyrosine-type recombinase/integrase n=1 Tax=Streptomyces griseoviridis TaxID=45398 RepID=UPI001F0C195F|nr:site-specific integrase [Streptomyces griseoviridis]